MSLEEAARSLCDFSTPFDVALLEQVLAVAFDPTNAQNQQAHHVVIQLQEHPDMWQVVSMIIENSTNLMGTIFAVQVLQKVIQQRWKALPAEQRAGMKGYVINLIMTICQNGQMDNDTRTLLSKMNMTLVEIVKREWPEEWPNFVPEIVELSKQSEALCENNMHILKILSEEVFDFGMDQTTATIRKLKETFQSQFNGVFELCSFIMERSTMPSLLLQTLQTLRCFMSWIDKSFIFESSLIPQLIRRFFTQTEFRSAALHCLTEVNGLPVTGVQSDDVFQAMYNAFMQELLQVLPPEVNIREAYASASEDDEQFVRGLALFFTSFFSNHLQRLEREASCHELILRGFSYLLRISEVDDEEIFKICLDFYHSFAQGLYRSEMQAAPGARPLRKRLYHNVLHPMLVVIIGRMAKPEEVLVIEDEAGNIVREMTKDTAVIAQYQTQRETLVYLTHLDHERTQNIMLQKLGQEVDTGPNAAQGGWHALNTLCWAVGSISGAMSEEEEKRFLVTVIKDLLNLCEIKRGKDNKAVIASNIMYVVGQYPRFLRAHWKFLRTVVNKLFEFMHERHPGVQDMACDTFLKIAQKCKRKFLQLQDGETRPYIEQLAEELPYTISDLQPHQVKTFYEAVGTMLSDRGQAVVLSTQGRSMPVVDRAAVLGNVCAQLNQQFKEICARGADQDALCDVVTAEALQKVWKFNAAICRAASSVYAHQLSIIYHDSISIYGIYSERIHAAVQQQGEVAIRMTQFRALRNARKEFLKLLGAFVAGSGEPESGPQMLLNDVLPPLLDTLLKYYGPSLPAARDWEVFAILTAFVDKLKTHVAHEMPRIMEAVFQPTIEMLTVNFEDYPDMRVNFFQFVKEINKNCFTAIINLPEQSAKLVIDAIMWGTKHTDRSISEVALKTLYDFLQNVRGTASMSQPFYRGYLLWLVESLLALLTDRLHKSDFSLHATLLRHLFHIVELGHVQVPLFDPSAAAPGMNNSTFVKEQTAALLLRAFPNLVRPQVDAFMHGLFDMNKDLETFKNLLRDFLVDLKEFRAENNQDLYSEEQSRQREAQQEAERQRLMAVPGLVKPSDRDLDDL